MKKKLDWYKILAITIMVVCTIITIVNLIDMMN